MRTPRRHLSSQSSPADLPVAHMLCLIRSIACSIVIFLGATGGRICAQQNEGISVTGVGEVRANPDTLELNILVTGKAELGDDALVKFRSARETTLKALSALKMPALKIEPGGVVISASASQAMMQAIANGEAAPAHQRPLVHLSTNFRLKFSGVKDLSGDEVGKAVSRLLDAAQDSGAQNHAGCRPIHGRLRGWWPGGAHGHFRGC